MIFKMVMLPDSIDNEDHQFVLGTNNGVAFMLINKATLQMKLAREAYLPGKTINTLIIRGNAILALEHTHNKLMLIDR